MRSFSNSLATIRFDIPASIVVFLVALPLCLGIALASGAPMLSGLIAGVVGGVVVTLFSRSQVSVSGPAAGLTTIVISALATLGSYEAFLCAVILAGMLQIVFSIVRAGTIGHFVPVSVIKGMLAAIGLILILKQIPHAFGYDRDFEGDENFYQPDGENTFTEIWNAIDYVSPGAIVISFISILVLILWEKPFFKEHRFLRFIPGPLVVVLLGMTLNIVFRTTSELLTIQPEHIVSLPRADALLSQMIFPDVSHLANPKVYITAITLALVASLESLLSIEAADKLDPLKRITPLNTELRAQGIGNIVSGLLGGLPITAVIVRTSANVHAGARTKLSSFVHGILLLSAVLLIPGVLNMIPFSALAAILIVTGYKLVKPALFREMYHKGWDQLIPFVVTIVAIIATNLLIGIFIGISVGLIFVLRSNFQQAITVIQDGKNFLLKLNKDVSFLNKAMLRDTFEKIPDGAYLILDGDNAQFVDQDILDTLEDFLLNARGRGIEVEIKKNYAASNYFFRKLN
jgi:MFS superfamily sulfate permease-like transporter